MSTQSVYRLTGDIGAELEQMREMCEQFASGAIPAPRFQAFRVPRGIYEQRESGTYMLRARLAAGIILPAQLRAAAEAAQTYGDATLHFTSRQDLQVHGVEVENIVAALRVLADAGLSTKGGGGNTVRNIAACYQAGVCRKELFDVTPHVVGLTEYLLPDPLSYQLPRKYKIAFSGCGADCAGATINDLGFIARERDGVRGFAVYVGGGMGAESRVGQLLEEFVPADHVPAVSQAVKQVFDKHGNRKNRHRARIRFLVEDLGLEEFKRLYREELKSITVAASEPRAFAPPAACRQFETILPDSDYAEWRALHVEPQKQPGQFTVEIAPPLGLLTADQLLRLAAIIENHGEGVARATNWQSFMLRCVSETELPLLHAELSELGLGAARPALLRRMVVCTGASTCRLGICLARGLAQAIAQRLSKSVSRWKPATNSLALHISGCPNACGRHPAAQIGLYGAARRINGHLVPHYVVQLGGHVAEGETVLASGSTLLPARAVPAFLEEFLDVFDASPHHPDFAAFLRGGGRDTAAALAVKFPDDKNFYYDWGAREPFSLAGRGPGECGAGVFDLIQVDLATAADALKARRLFAATAAAARALLVTHGEQATTDREALELFERVFVQGGLVADEFAPLIERARKAVNAHEPEAVFQANAEEVQGLLDAVRELYRGMGPSLRVSTPSAPVESQPDIEKDFSGVVCPLNYVKTKMALAGMKPGDVLSVLLSENGAQNVPQSAANDGHEILSVERAGRHWRVLIRKGGK